MERLEYSKNEYAAGILAAYYNRTPVAFVRSFGCQQSVNDGERLKGVLQDIGFTLGDEPEGSDLILFNTCAVREHAEQRVFGNIGALKILKQQNPKLLIGICGCMSEEAGNVEKIQQSFPYVDMVLGANVADILPQIIVERVSGGKRNIQLPEKREEIVEQIPQVRDSSFKAFLPIMYGCDNFCSYCIVPYVRGRERSRSSADILQEFQSLVQAGYKEITLLGQNVNSYGKGLQNEIDFSDLLSLLCKTEGDYKVRFLTSHPKDATRKLIDTIVANPHLCKHLHLPVQSGSNNILEKMNRRYTAESYLELINYAKSVCPEMTFSTDIIVGFPGETEEDFAKTLDLIRKVEYTQVFTFIYSKRSGTKAAELEDNTPHKLKAERLGQILEIQEKIVAKLADRWIGNEYPALVEGSGRKKGFYSGRLDNNMSVEFESAENYTGQIINLHIDAVKRAILAGSVTT